jgi:hypothetical protein
MAINYGFGSVNNKGPQKSSNLSRNSGLVFGRVVDIITDAFHPKYQDYGGSQSVNGVFYVELGTNQIEDNSRPLSFAFQGNSNIRETPLKNEIVVIQSYPSEIGRDIDSQSQKKYWTNIVKLWNHPHHNAYPDIQQFQSDSVDLGDYFEEQTTTNPLLAFPGDVLLEGRHGNTIRLGGTRFDSNTFTDNSNNGKPYIIIRNGQLDVGNSVDSVVEDINEDASSIYFTSDHIINLEQANTKRLALDTDPDQANVYKGKQLLFNSDRIFINARQEGAYISSKQFIALNSDAVGIDGEKYVGVDAKKIYLGNSAFKEQEPALKGQTSTDWLDDLTTLLESLARTLATTPPSPPTYIAALIKEGTKLQAQLPQLKNLLTQLHSKKVFIDNI